MLDVLIPGDCIFPESVFYVSPEIRILPSGDWIQDDSFMEKKVLPQSVIVIATNNQLAFVIGEDVVGWSY